MVSVRVSAKLAVTVLLSFIVTVVDALFGSATSPLQFTNWYPEAGVAETDTTVPSE